MRVALVYRIFFFFHVPVRLIILDNNSQKYNKIRFFRDKVPNILFSRGLLSYIFPVLLFLCN